MKKILGLVLSFTFIGLNAFASEKLKWTQDILAEFKKSPESKTVHISSKNPHTLMVSNLSRTITVDLERTDKAFIYLLNRKELNLKTFADEESLQKTIESYLPKVAVTNSWWLGRAWGQGGGSTYSSNRKAISEGIIKLSAIGDKVGGIVFCEELTEFVNNCDNFSKDLAIIAKTAPSTPGYSSDQINAALEKFAASSKKFEVLVVEARMKLQGQNTLNRCYSSSEGKPGELIKIGIARCERSLSSATSEVEKIPRPKSTQLAAVSSSVSRATAELKIVGGVQAVGDQNGRKMEKSVGAY